MKTRHYMPIYLVMLMSSVACAESLTIGVGVAASKLPYKDVSTQVTPLPIINYNNNNFYINVDKIGYIPWQKEKQYASVELSYQPGFNPNDSDDTAMKGLKKRRSSVMAGANYHYNSAYGGVGVNIATDALSENKGTIIGAGYNYAFQGNKWYIIPEAGINWSDGKYNDYYYGVRAEETARTGIKTYQAQSGFTPYVQIVGNYRILPKWSTTAAFRVDKLASEIKNSPIVSSDNSTTVMFDVKYHF